MLTGRRPFEGKNQASLIGAILDHWPPPVTMFQPVSPPMLDEIVARCLATDPDERWPTARDFKRQLEWVAKQLAEGGAKRRRLLSRRGFRWSCQRDRPSRERAGTWSRCRRMA